LINNPSLDTNRRDIHHRRPPPLEPRWHVKKTLPPIELQIPATVTTLGDGCLSTHADPTSTRRIIS